MFYKFAEKIESNPNTDIRYLIFNFRKVFTFYQLNNPIMRSRRANDLIGNSRVILLRLQAYLLH